MGLMQGGGFQYYGGPSGAASGANAFVENFLRTKLAMEDSGRKQAEAEMMNKIRAQQLVELERKTQEEQQWKQMAAQRPYMQQTDPYGGEELTPLGNSRLQGLMQGVPKVITNQASDPTYADQSFTAPNPEYAQRKALVMDALRQKGGETPDIPLEPRFFDSPEKYFSAKIQQQAADNKGALTASDVFKNAKNYTKESLKIFLGGGAKDFSVLVPTEKAGKNKSIFVDPSGKTVLVDLSDPNAQDIIDSRKLKSGTENNTNIRVQGFSATPVAGAPGVYFDKLKRKFINAETNQEIGQADLKTQIYEFGNLKKAALTANSPTFRRLVNNAEILAVGVVDPKTGKNRGSELDQIVDLRNQLDDKLFSKINSDLQAFNTWDQWLSYKTSDPKMARLLSKVMAATDTLGSIYAGGGTVTSDFKMKFARDMFETALSREAFKAKLDAHKESVLDRAYKFSEVNPQGVTPTSPVSQEATPTKVWKFINGQWVMG